MSMGKGEVFHEYPISLGTRSYSIIIGRNLLEDETQWLQWAGRRALIVTSEILAPLYLDSLLRGLASLEAETMVLPDGEQHKTLETMAAILDRLVKAGHTRKSILIAMGGGVIGDLTGFAAACYQRGIDYIQVPTTLLAQVDSSVGGKTGVNHALGKNMFGAFHQPIRVIADLDTLSTLVEREYKAGLAELVKHAIILDEDFFDWLETHVKALVARNSTILSEALRRSVAIKAEIVARDERESGLRMLLNFGHTFGHAIETCCGYGSLLHGEAVAMGMSMAVKLSVHLGLLDSDAGTRITDFLHSFKLPTTFPPTLSPDVLYKTMRHDKKAHDTGLRFIILNAIGQAGIIDSVSKSDVLYAIETRT